MKTLTIASANSLIDGFSFVQRSEIPHRFTWRQNWSQRIASVLTTLAVVSPLLTLVLFSTPALAQSRGFGNDNHGCAADRPCFNGSRQLGDKVIFNFTGITGWDFFNVRYAQVGGGVKQVENRSGSFTFNNTKPRRVYTLNVQGCNSHALRRSSCSPWNQQSVTTK